MSGLDRVFPASRRPQEATQVRMLDQLLERSSRTFALSIPLLPEPCRTRTTLAYLLFRVADTFEDETAWPPAERLSALARLRDALADDAEPLTELAATAAGLDTSVIAEAGYAELLDALPAVTEAWRGLEAEARSIIAGHLRRTIDGMASWIDRGTPPQTVAEVRRYCYHVAGIVGELCTELFVLQSPTLTPARDELRRLAPAFGETLQLVNILRDESDDADEGRRFVPSPAARAELEAVAQAAREDAAAYIAALAAHAADPGIVAFNALNLALAKETLALVAKLGPGVKLPRDRVAELHAEIVQRTDAGNSVAGLVE